LRACIPLAAAAPAAGQQVWTSPAPETVSVTIYRAPHRSPGQALDLDWLGGYALITETRRVSIAAGEAELRFEGVAGGIIPESAIVTGLPKASSRRTRTPIFSPRTACSIGASGKRVHIRRTAPGGKVTEHEAVIRTGADGAVVLQTSDGFEALRCSGFNETIVYPSVPKGLSAKPTLSVRTRSGHSAQATVTLSYLASGFDWQANYVANVTESGSKMDLFAWVTLANGDETSFENASTQAVAGRVNREGSDSGPREGGRGIQLRCWPSARTSDIPLRRAQRGGWPPPTATATAASNGGVSRRRGEHRRHRLPDRPAGGARRPQALPNSGAGDRRVQQPETGSFPREGGGPVPKHLSPEPVRRGE
jgi:hypothetical protein